MHIIAPSSPMRSMDSKQNEEDEEFCAARSSRRIICFNATSTRSRGIPTLRCLDSDCNVLSGSEDERREHAIKAHAFPRGYYFDVVQEGIGSLLHQHGPGASLLVSVAAEAGPAKRPAIGMETQADQASSSTWACEENAFVRHKRTRSSSDADEVRERTPGILQGSLPSLPSPSLHSPSVPSANAFSNLVDELGSLSLIPNVLTRRQKRIVA